MKENKNFAFFAAANGYSGFRSYFDEVFNPKDYTKIYILKGGPGTGKSTIMKSLYSQFEDKATQTEAIYCSSDPKSLDGVILEKNSTRIAVIDGTAPHERDAHFPGAIDEIINLGECWDKRWLEAKRDMIIPLCEEKKNAYKTAYSYLSAAGIAHRAKSALEISTSDTKIAKNSIKNLADSILASENPQKKTRLISAFGKSGVVRFDTLKKISERYIGVSGATRAVNEYIAILWKETKEICNTVRIPSPLDDSITEAIYFPDSHLTIVADETAEDLINADDFCKCEVLDKERSRVFSSTESNYLSEAERWFKIAADLHSRLEEIYYEAMNFEKNNDMLASLTEEISEKISS